jgi:hypothetical protein
MLDGVDVFCRESPGPPGAPVMVHLHGFALSGQYLLHAINFSHPGELANVIRQFMADEPIEDDPASPGRAHAFETYRGVHLPTVRGRLPPALDEPSSDPGRS